MIILKIPRYCDLNSTAYVTYNDKSEQIEVHHPVIAVPISLPKDDEVLYGDWAVYPCVVEPGFIRFIAIRFTYGIIVDATEEEVYEVSLYAFANRIAGIAGGLWLKNYL